MDFSKPFGGLIGNAQGAVLAVLLRTGKPLTGRQIHSIISDDHSLWSTQQSLKTLEALGLVTVVSVGKANLYGINSQHYAIEPLRVLADPIAALTTIISDTVDPEVTSVILFGSIPRGEAQHDSDIDLAVIAPAGWSGRTALQAAVTEHLGNECDVLVITESDLDNNHLPVISDILREGIVLHGESIFNLRERHLNATK